MSNEQSSPRTAIAILLLSMVLTACAAGVDLVRDGTVNLERVPSTQVKISDVHVLREDGVMAVYGKITPFRRAGFIPGHIHMEVIDPNGKLLRELSADYKRGDTKSRSAHFYVQLPMEPPVGSTVRVIHHRAGPAPVWLHKED